MQEADDGLFTPDVGAWSEEKYAHVRTYAEIFATSMRHKWKCRVYLDLFAGAGKAMLRESRKVVESSAFLALGVTHPFDRYVFCDSDTRCVTALKARAECRVRGRRCQCLGADDPRGYPEG